MKNIIFKFKPKCIFNLAAETHVDRSIDEPKNLSNQILLEFLISWKILKNTQKNIIQN